MHKIENQKNSKHIGHRQYTLQQCFRGYTIYMFVYAYITMPLHNVQLERLT